MTIEIFVLSGFFFEPRGVFRDRSGVLYHVGQVIRHKKFGYRGVICAWDKRPRCDVSNWWATHRKAEALCLKHYSEFVSPHDCIRDGVRGLPSRDRQPFYFVYQNQRVSDEEAKLSAITMHPRYVAQENIELAPKNDTFIEHPDTFKSFSRFSLSQNKFLADELLIFKVPGLFC